MNIKDYRNDEITGATAAALEAYETALSAFQRWRCGVDMPLARATALAPRFAMAHVLDAYRFLMSRDPVVVARARTARSTLMGLEMNRRERLHAEAIGAAVEDDYEAAKARLDALLDEFPRDVLALQAGHAFDYATGDEARMADRVASVLPAWSPSAPGYSAVLAMYAFSLVESGDYRAAERMARSVLARDPDDGRARHALAHVHEMTSRYGEGIGTLRESVESWSRGTVVATHCWWHLALFHLALGDSLTALSIYDGSLRARRSLEVADLIDASALLWRLELEGADVGGRWTELSAAWASHIEDGFCSFNDIHAMLAFVGAHDEARARGLEKELVRRSELPTRHGETTRLVGLAACRGIMAHGRGDHREAVDLLGRLPFCVQRIGGSHAQRDVVYLTLMQSLDRLRRPAMKVAA